MGVIVVMLNEKNGCLSLRVDFVFTTPASRARKGSTSRQFLLGSTVRTVAEALEHANVILASPPVATTIDTLGEFWSRHFLTEFLFNVFADAVV